MFTLLKLFQRSHRLVADLADNGLRFDLTPTMPLSSDPNQIHGFYQDYLRRIDAELRERAGMALGRPTILCPHRRKKGDCPYCLGVRVVR